MSVDPNESGRQYNRRQLLPKYGLSLEDYDALYVEQNGCCAICQEHYDVLDVDHDHETDEVRGLLCTRCNTGLGMFRDRIRLLAAAIVYLEDNGRKW